MSVPYIQPTPDPVAVRALTDAGIAPLVAHLLVLRGADTVTAAEAFLRPALRDLPDPHLMADCEKAAALLCDAIVARKQICVYGDYDVDGISAAALLHDVLVMAGARPKVFLPDRLRDGYGLHLGRLTELAQAGAQVFVSADCGTSSHKEIVAMRALGCQFVVCDHHALLPTLPDADAVLNPRRLDCQYPDKNLCAVGVALVLAQALKRVCVARSLCTPQAFDLRDVMELAALGTIGDVVELRHVNRTLALHGLRALGQSKRPGVAAMAQTLTSSKLAASRVGFALGPKINAAGRIAEPRTAFEVLTTRDAARGHDLAVQLDVAHVRRKVMTKQMVAEGLALAEEQPRDGALVVAQRGWHPGVVGLVAMRLSERFEMPTFALAIDADGLTRGSGRSVPGFDLVAALHACAADLLDRFGGHAYAAGVTLQAERIPAFAQRLSAYVQQTLGRVRTPRELRVDAEIGAAEANLDLLDLLEQLEPYGKGNAAPHFLMRGVQLQKFSLMGDSGFASGFWHEPGPQAAYARSSVRGFGPIHAWGDARNDGHYDVVLKLERDAYNNKQYAQARVELVLPASAAR